MKRLIQAAVMTMLCWTAACGDAPSETVETWLAVASQEAWTAAQQSQASAAEAERHSENTESNPVAEAAKPVSVPDVFDSARVPPLPTAASADLSVQGMGLAETSEVSSEMLPENEALTASSPGDGMRKKAGGVRYVGFIQSDRNIRALLEIGGTVYPVRQGQHLQKSGIRVLRIQTDRLWLEQAGSRREIRLDKVVPKP